MDPNSTNPLNPTPIDPNTVSNTAPLDNPSIIPQNDPTINQGADPSTQPIDIQNSVMSQGIPTFDKPSLTQPNINQTVESLPVLPNFSPEPLNFGVAEPQTPLTPFPDQPIQQPIDQQGPVEANIPLSSIPTSPIESPLSDSVPPSPAVSSNSQDSAIPSFGGSSMPPPESMPTDLSHLIVNSGSDSGAGNMMQPQVATVPPNNGSSQTVVTSEPHSFPKAILIIGGILLFLIVAGASAYFILGIGQSNPPEANSLPIEQPSLTKPPQPLLPTEVPVAPATSSATLGNIPGNNIATPASTATGSGTSAIELLRRRQ